MYNNRIHPPVFTLIGKRTALVFLFLTPQPIILFPEKTHVIQKVEKDSHTLYRYRNCKSMDFTQSCFIPNRFVDRRLLTLLSVFSVLASD